MKNFPVYVLIGLFLAACGRESSTAIEQSAPAEKPSAIDKSGSRSVQGEKEMPYKEFPVKSDGTIQDLIRATSSTNDYKALYDSATRKHNSGDFTGAISDFERCISIKPDFSDAYNFRAMSKYKSGDKSGACSDWKKAVQLGYSRAQNMVDGYCR